MFSGEYFTSISQIMTSGAVFIAWLFCNRRLLKDVMAKLENKTSQFYLQLVMVLMTLETFIDDFHAKFFGDDGIVAIPVVLMKLLFLGKKAREASGMPDPYPFAISFEDFLTFHCDMELKVTDSAEYQQLYTVVKNDEIVKPGPKILKRHFMYADIGELGDGKPTVVAWRPCQVWKAATPILEHMTFEHQMMRLVGMLWDTQGNNMRQYTMLRKMIDYCMVHIPESKSYASFYAQYTQRPKTDASTRVKQEFIDRMRRLIGDADLINMDVDEYLKEIPSISKLQSFFNRPFYGIETVVPNRSWSWYQKNNLT